MASASALERNGGGAERTRRSPNEGERERETRKNATGFFYDDNSADDELATLMPALKRRFEAFDADEGTLNFMGELNTSNVASFHRNENKENAPQMRRKSGRKSIMGPIDFDRKFRIKNGATPPSGSLYRNITTALKENVNRAELQSQNVDDFWASERQKKISAVVRRRMSGIKTPAGQTKAKPVEDRRRSRARYGGENGRRPGNRPIKWDLYLDAAKISEWDQETLAEEEVAPSTRANCAAFLSAGGPGLQNNLAILDQRQERNEGAEQDGLPAARRNDDFQAEETKSNVPGEASSHAGSACSLPDMDLSTGESPLVKIPDFFKGEKSTHNSLQDPNRTHADLAMEDVFMPEDAVGVEPIGQIWPRGGENLDRHPEKIVPQDSVPRDCNLEGDPPLTPLQGFPVLDSCDLQQEERLAATSPTPPSNPVAVYMSLRLAEGEVRQRRLAFLSSPSSDSIETKSSQEREELNSVGSSSGRDSVQVGPHDTPLSKKDVEVEEMDLGVVESRKVPSLGEPLHSTTSKDEFEGRNQPCSEESPPKASCEREPFQDTHEVRTQKDGEVERDGAGSPAYLRRSSSKCDDNESVQEETVQSAARHPRPVGNALQALSYDYGDDDEDLEAPDVKELEPLHQERNGTSLADHTAPEIVAQNRDESFGEVGVENNAQTPPEKLKDGEAAPPGAAVPPGVTVQPDVAHEGGPIGTDEGSTTQIKPARIPRKRAPKAKNKRSSLEGCGSVWKDGQRSSQRIRVNPVEWWRGEKLLYGRIHETLTTVIGIKYSSRGVDTPFVVESYVPPEYDELVHFAAV